MREEQLNVALSQATLIGEVKVTIHCLHERILAREREREREAARFMISDLWLQIRANEKYLAVMEAQLARDVEALNGEGMSTTYTECAGVVLASYNAG